MASNTQTSNETQSFDPITQQWRQNVSQAAGQLMGGYGLSSMFGNSGLGRAPAPPMEYNQHAALRNGMHGAMSSMGAAPADPTNVPPRGLLAPQQPQYRQFGPGAFRPQAGGQVMDPRMLQMMMQRRSV